MRRLLVFLVSTSPPAPMEVTAIASSLVSISLSIEALPPLLTLSERGIGKAVGWRVIG